MKVTSLDVSNLLSFEGFHLDFDDRLTVENALDANATTAQTMPYSLEVHDE